MKIFAFTILVWLSVLQTSAQETYGFYTNYYAIEVGVVASSAGLAFGPAFSVYRSGHKIDAGLNIKFYDVWKDGPGIMGTYLGYKYYPNLRKNTVNLYFGYHNIFSVHNKGRRFSQLYDEASDTYRSPTLSYLLENLIGIGFDLQMGNRFFMYSDFNVGAVLEWSQYKESDSQFEVRSTGMIRLGIGYNIAWKQAK